MVEYQTKTLTDTISIEASAEKTLDLPRNGYITHLDLLIKLNLDTATAGATPKEDPIDRFIDLLVIEAGARKFFAVEDGRQLKYLNLYDYQQIDEDSLPTSGGVSGQDVYAQRRIHFGFNPIDVFDPTSVIPALKSQFTNLKLRVRFNAASELGTGYTLNSGEIKVTVYQLVLDEEKEEEIWANGIIVPIMNAVELNVNAVKTDLGFEDDIPVGNVLYRTQILTLDSSANRSDGIVSEYGIKLPKVNKTPYKINWRTSVRKDKAQYHLPSTYTGVTVLDWEDISGLELGMYLSEFEKGDVKIGFTTLVSSGYIKLMHQGYTLLE